MMITEERTFKASRLDTALAKVKRELGPDAVILSSRHLSGGVGVEVRATLGAKAVHGRGLMASQSDMKSGLLYKLLLRNGFDDGMAGFLVAAAPGNPRTLRAASEALAGALEMHLAFKTPELGRSTRVLALVGPTGVGKTTTIAKIAAHEALVNRRTVALITVDGFRVGATAQLEQYAELIGIPLATARNHASFTRALERFADADLILIDTPGRGPRDHTAIGKLAELLHGTEETVEVSLCVPAASRVVELDEIIERYRALLPRTLTVTKLDEAYQHHAIVAAHIASGLPLAWFTTGQRVPEDFEIAAPQRLATALCGEELHQ